RRLHALGGGRGLSAAPAGQGAGAGGDRQRRGPRHRAPRAPDPAVGEVQGPVHLLRSGKLRHAGSGSAGLLRRRRRAGAAVREAPAAVELGVAGRALLPEGERARAAADRAGRAERSGAAREEGAVPTAGSSLARLREQVPAVLLERDAAGRDGSVPGAAAPAVAPPTPLRPRSAEESGPVRLDMAGLGFRSALWRTIERARHDYPVLLGELRRQQWLPREEVEAVQRRRLIRLLQHAFENVPYYRAVLGSAGVVRGDGSVHLERFTEIEPLSRQVVIREGQNLWSRTASPRECHLNASGGSTGEPVRHLQDRVCREYGLAVKALFDEWTGYRVGRRQVRLWGSERDLGVANESLKRRVGRWLRSELWLNAFRMDETRMREYVRRINAFRPYQLLGYANSLYELATFVQREGLDVHAPGAVMSSAGTLFPHMRERIEGVFRAPVFNRYGSREVGDVACECERHRGLHVCTPTHLIEVLGPDGGPVGPGEVGEVVVTLLT